MELVVLGKYGPYPKSGGATSAYLLKCADKKLLLDAGSGCISRLQAFCEMDNLDMAVLTHLHADHFADMLIMRYVALQNKLPVFLPSTPTTEHDLIAAGRHFDPRDINEEMKLTFDDADLQISFCRTIHPVECYAVKIIADGKIFVYTGDACYSDKLTDFCKDADILLADSGFLARQERSDDLPHMYVEEAALMAKRARVGKLLLTHINPDYHDNEILCEAAGIFPKCAVIQEKTEYVL
ncbi:MAG: MBL fold metallo-hydrolase [Christensenella sp.]|nr:MBL fold metallo-hydrolase [Christensenella sp.]